MKTVSDDILKTWSKYAKTYDPIKCASIDGTDIEPHDRAVIRALNSTYKPNRFVKGRPECTLFVSRLNHETSKDTIKDLFSKYGKLKRFRMVKDIVTGMPKGYAFVEYEEEQAAEDAYRLTNKMVVDGQIIFVDFECERLLKGWKPRRLGGGFGGKKESGQLRFGGRDRPFKKPIALELKEQEERRRREKEKRVLDEERRRRDKRRTPLRENGVPPKNRRNWDSRDREKRPLSPRSSSPPRKVSRHHSPSKQIDKTSRSQHSENTNANSPSEKINGKRSHSQESKQQNSCFENNKSNPCPKENGEKSSGREQAKQKSSVKDQFAHKSPISEQAKHKSSPSRSKAKHRSEHHHHSSPRQNGRPQTPERYKRSPRNPYRSHSPEKIFSPERGADRRRSPVPKYAKRPPAREERRSVPPHQGNVHCKSIEKDDDRRNQTFRGESPERKLGRYQNDRRHSPIQSFSERYPSGRDKISVSPNRIRKYSPPNRAYQSHQGKSGRGVRRSPGCSPSRPDKSFRPSFDENIRGHNISNSSQRHTRDDPFIHERKRDPGSVDLYPKEHVLYSPGHRSGRHSPYGGYSEHSPSHRYQEDFEYNRGHHLSSQRGGEFISSHTDLRQYSPSRLDLRQPPPSYEHPRDYTSYRDNMAVSRSRNFVPSKETNPQGDPDRRYASQYSTISRDSAGEHLRHFLPEPQLERQYISSNRSPRRETARGGRGFRRN